MAGPRRRGYCRRQGLCERAGGQRNPVSPRNPVSDKQWPTAVNERLYEVYCELADWHDRHGQPQLRDRFLVLAADAALAAGAEDEAERLRARLLHANPHHLLKPFASFAQALRSPDVESYVASLRQSYPLEAAEAMLASLRGEPPPERGAEPALPPTMPVVDLGRPPDGPGPGESLKLFPFLDEPGEPVPTLPAWQEPPRPAPPRRPAPPARKPAPPPRPAAAPPARGPRPQPAATSAPNPPEPAGPEEQGVSWVASGLFVLVLLAGLALAGYTLGWPFLPGP